MLVSLIDDMPMATSPADVGALIRERRREFGLTQQALADSVGVSRQWIVEVERGKARAEIGLLLRLLHALDLMMRIDPRPPDPLDMVLGR